MTTPLAVLIALLLSTTLLWPAPSLVSAQPGVPVGATEVDWTPLGFLGPYGVTALAVSPAWPVDKTIVAQRGPDTILTPDGGQHWERRGTPPFPLIDFSFAESPPGVRLLLSKFRNDVYRSLDLGQTWQVTLSVPDPEVQISPNVGADRQVFVLGADGTLWRSQDAAATWQALHPADEQLVQSFQLSPDFASDHTIVAAVVGGGTFLTHQPWSEFPASDPETSVGIVLSSDGGETWTPQVAGLAVDDQPYRAVQSVHISPSFSQDGVIFAIAWGDPQASVQFDSPVTAMKRALFKSADRGRTWDAVDSDGPFNYPTRSLFAMSPNFSQDGIALWGKNYFFGTPASGACRISRSSDAGTSWSDVLATTAQYSWCDRLALHSARGKLFAHVQMASPLNQQWSDDAGQTWSSFELSATPVFASVGATIFVGFRPYSGSGGLFGLGSGELSPTTAAPPCSEPVAGGFARVLENHPEVRNLLGCPLAPEGNAQISIWADKPGAGGLTLWPDNGSLDLLGLYAVPWTGDGRYRRAQASPYAVSATRLGPPDVVLPGAVQPFEASSYFVFTRGIGESPGTIYAVSGNGIWAQFADSP